MSEGVTASTQDGWQYVLDFTRSAGLNILLPLQPVYIPITVHASFSLGVVDSVILRCKASQVAPCVGPALVATTLHMQSTVLQCILSDKSALT